MRFNLAPSNMNEATFLKNFAEVYEHSSWIAEQIWQQGLNATLDEVNGLARAMRQIVESATHQQQLDLINAHPDLAGRAAQAGELTSDSSHEQASAGINQCNSEEFKRFQEYNQAYKDKFNFPFIMAVKNSDRHQILESFAQRLPNTAEAEFRQALDQIHKIAGFRLAHIAQLEPAQ